MNCWITDNSRLRIGGSYRNLRFLHLKSTEYRNYRNRYHYRLRVSRRFHVQETSDFQMFPRLRNFAHSGGGGGGGGGGSWGVGGYS